MCIPHGAKGGKIVGAQTKERPKKHVTKVSQREFEKGDPNFVDERTTPYEKHPEKSSFFSSIFGV
jgi:hypothetical protein